MSRNPYTATDFAFQIELILVQLEQMNKRLDMLERTYMLLDTVHSQSTKQTATQNIKTEEDVKAPQKHETELQNGPPMLRRGSIA